MFENETAPAFLQPLFTWMESWAFTTAIVENEPLFALTLATHLLAMAVLVGCIAAVDLRLLGLSARQHGAERFAAEIIPWTWGAFVVAATTGLLLFAPQAARYAVNPTFQIKLALLLLAGVNMLAFHLLLAPGVSRWDRGPPPAAVRVSGGLSLALWLGVLAAGRLIAYDS